MAEDDERNNIKRALLRVLTRILAEGTLLDDEDQEVIVRYKMGELTEPEFHAITLRKATLLGSQQDRPN